MDVEELIAREEIRTLIARYNHAGDRGRLDELVACFGTDGVMEIEGMAALRGRSAIRRHLEGVVSQLAAASERATLRHHVSSISIELDSRLEARAHCYFAVFSEIGLDHWGRYADRFARVDGGWHIAHRRVRVDGAVPGSRMLGSGS